MPFVTFDVYRTIVVNGVATGDSELVQITIFDDGSNSIDRDEWKAYTGDSAGHIGGSVGGEPALWDGTTGALNDNATGTLYTSVPLTAGADVGPILDSITHAPKYDVSIDQLSVCFLAGTMIATPSGDRPVETLREGDMVLTRDHGPQPLVWVGESLVDEERLDRCPNLRPIHIKPGAIDGVMPRRALKVSAQHRILWTDSEGGEYLIAARHLQQAGLEGFSVIRNGKPFTLVHIACADHEVVLAEGAAAESYYTGPMAIRALGPAQKRKLFAAFPGLQQGENPMTPARPFVKRKDVKALVAKRAAELA